MVVVGVDPVVCVGAGVVGDLVVPGDAVVGEDDTGDDVVGFGVGDLDGALDVGDLDGALDVGDLDGLPVVGAADDGAWLDVKLPKHAQNR